MKHLGFRVTGTSPRTELRYADDFEVVSAAQECARYLDARGWGDVKCYEVIDRGAAAWVERFEHKKIDWRAQPVTTGETK